MLFYNVFINLYMFIMSFINVGDYTIKRIEMTYTSPPYPPAGYSDFWKGEKRYWSAEGGRMWTLVTNRFRDMGETPDGVKDRVFSVKYFHGGKKYRMVTKDPDFEWPPHQPPATFRVPVVSAVLMEKDKPIRVVTKKLLKAMGPRRDFHGQDVPVEDLFDYDDYTNVSVKDVMGVSKTIDRKSSCLQLL